MRVLLTGGNGFVGSHVLDRLLAEPIPTVLLLRPGCDTAFIAGRLSMNRPANREVLECGSPLPLSAVPAQKQSGRGLPHSKTLSRAGLRLAGSWPANSAATNEAPPMVEVRYGRLDDLGSLRAALEGVTHVIHCAGATKALRRQDLFRVNQLGTRNLIGAVNDTGTSVQRVVHLSSLAAGRPGTRAAPARESDPPRPVSAYGQSKCAGEREVTDRCRCPFTILRPSGVYGPRDREFLRLFKAAASGITPLFGGGRQELSLVFAPDLAEVVVRSLSATAAAGQILNVAGAELITSGGLARAVAAALGKRTIGLRLPNAVLNLVCLGGAAWAKLTRQPTLLAHGKRRELTAPGWVGDTSQLREVLGTACPTRLEDGLAATLTWYREQGWL